MECTIKKIIAALLILPLSTLSIAVESNKYRGHLGIIGKVGTDRSLGRLDLMIPLRQSDDSILFLDLRGVLSSNETQEGNFGVAYRQKLQNAPWILGGYAFYDLHESENNNTFRQLTFGTEALGEAWSIRANGYISLSGDARVKDNDEATLQGNNILVKEGIERGLSGFDAEIGRTIDLIPGLSAFIGGYHFDGDDVGNISGTRGRIEYSIAEMFAAMNMNGIPLLNQLTFTGEIMHDNERDTNASIGVRVIIPFEEKSLQKTTRLERRMTEVIIRDVDVITNENENASLANNKIGELLNVIVVDNTASDDGDGTLENPFNSLKAAENSALPYDLIYVKYGDGTNTNQDEGIILKKGQTLHGAGVAVTQLTPSGDNLLAVRGLERELKPSVISNAAGNGVVLADHTKIKGLVISDTALNGISGQNVSDIEIVDNVISDNTASGIFIVNTNNEESILNTNIKNNDISNNGNRGINLSNQSGDNNVTGDINLHNNRVMGNGESGIKVVTSGQNSNLVNISIEDSQVQGQNALDLASGINIITTAGKSNQSITTIKNTNASFNSFGVLINTLSAVNNSSQILINDVVTNNSANNGAGLSILNKAEGSLTTATQISNLNSSNNTRGVVLQESGSNETRTKITLENITANNNQFAGVELGSTAAESNNTEITLRNISTNNTKQNDGIILNVNANNANQMQLLLSNVEANENNGNGVNIISTSNMGDNESIMTLEDIHTTSNHNGLIINKEAAIDQASLLSFNRVTASNNDFIGIDVTTSATNNQISTIQFHSVNANHNNLLGIRVNNTAINENRSQLKLTDTVINNNLAGMQVNLNGANTITNDSTIVLNRVTAKDNRSDGITFDNFSDKGNNNIQISVQDSTFSQNTDTGLTIINSAELAVSGRTEINNSRFQGNGDLGLDLNHSARIADTQSDIIVTNNTIDGNSNNSLSERSGSRIEISTLNRIAKDNILITNNTISNHTNPTNLNHNGKIVRVTDRDIFTNQATINGILAEESESAILDDNLFTNNDNNILLEVSP